MSKNTAVEWLVTELRNHIAEGTLDAIAISKLKMQAKEMERWQIEQAYDRGHHNCFHGIHGKHKEYYNETYKGGLDESKG
jgi:hypothetical protein